MKRMVLVLGVLFLFTACETGTKYKTEDSSPKINILKKNPTIAELIEGPAPVEKEYYDPNRHPLIQEDDYTYQAVQNFEGGVISDGLNVKSIRKGRHHDYERLVFDIKTWTEYGRLEEREVPSVGYYNATYDASKQLISVVINGYRSFTAALPTFPEDSMIEKIYLEKYHENSGYKFNIKLKKSTEVKMFDLKSPARMVFDIKSI